MTKQLNACVPSGLVVLLSLILGLALINPMSLYAQSFYGSIVGAVTDSSGAIVTGATVTITNTSTNEKRSAQSNSAGDYSFVSLVPAIYKVEVEKANFKRFLRGRTIVNVSSTTRVDVSLEVGAATETVEVTTQAPLLQTDSGSVGATVQGKTVEEMPLNGRNTMNLLALSSSVVGGVGTAGSSSLNNGGHTAVNYWGNYSIGGGLSAQGAMYIDGAPLNMLGGNYVGYIPQQDSVQEFNVSTNATSAEYGRYSGGVVNMTTKSGTNQWHGSAYEYLRNRVFNANEWWNKKTQAAATTPTNKRTQWNQNQYGAVASGPIKRDKAFFMFTWEGFIARTASLNSGNVPTQDMQDGKVSGNLTTNSWLMNATNGACPAATYVPVSGSTGYTQIPASCWDSTAKVVKTHWPLPANSIPNSNF